MLRYSNKQTIINLGLPVNDAQPKETDKDKETDKAIKHLEDLEKPTSTLGFLKYWGEGVVIVDHQRVIRAVNGALMEMLGWSEAELLGKYCLDLFQCQQPVTATNLCQNFCPLFNLFSKTSKTSKTRQVVYEDISIATKSGERREVSASFAPLELPLFSKLKEAFPPSTETQGEGKGGEARNNSAYSIMVLRDITESKRQERIKTEFVETASHQLRTPLFSIKTSINLLIDHVDEDFSPLLLRLLQNIRSSSLRMERLVNDLIELTNLQSGRTQLQRRSFEVSQLIVKAMELNRERLETRHQTIKLNLPDTPLYVEADHTRISQVLGHLISNAGKFSAEGKRIELQVEAGTGSKVIFRVRDEGIGIAPEEQSLVFEKFYQSRLTENAEEIGSGLGLPLAKALVELNGGRLWLESVPGKGSTFYFSLPAPSLPHTPF